MYIDRCHDLRRPNLFLLGPAKTATTSMAYWLSQHRDFFVSEPKETHYFEFEYDRGTAFYLHKYFRHQTGQKVIVDGRPMHLTVGYCAERIYETCPDAKFVVILRHPIERMYSDWFNWSNMRPGRADPSFDIAIYSNMLEFNLDKFNLEGDYVPFCDSKGGCYKPSYIEASMYGYLLQRYIKLFGRDRILVLDFDDVSKDPQAAVDSICSFMNINKCFIPVLSERNMTPKKHKSKKFSDIIPMLSSRVHNFLTEQFYNDGRRLIAQDIHIAEKWNLI